MRIYLLILFAPLVSCSAIKIKDALDIQFQKKAITGKNVLLEYSIKVIPAFSDEAKDIEKIGGPRFSGIKNVFRNVSEERLYESNLIPNYAIVKEGETEGYKGFYDYKIKINIIYSYGMSFYFVPALFLLSLVPAKMAYADYSVQVKIFNSNDSVVSKYKFQEEVSYWHSLYSSWDIEEHSYSVNAFKYIIDKVLYKMQEDRLLH